MNWSLKHIVSSLFIVFGSLFLKGQNIDTLTIPDKYSISVLSIDAKSNFYAADNANTLHKFNNKGVKITNANTKIYGNIRLIDCSNPFEIYAYYNQTNVVVYYDNMLNVKGETNLNTYEFYNISDVIRSYNNGLWFFDYSSFKLLNINKFGDIIASSNNLIQEIGREISILSVKEFENHIYLADSSFGVMKFDLYGNYVTTFYINNFTNFIPAGNFIYFTSTERLLKYNVLTRNYTPIHPQINDFELIAVQNERLIGVQNNYILSATAD